MGSEPLCLAEQSINSVTYLQMQLLPWMQKQGTFFLLLYEDQDGA